MPGAGRRTRRARRPRRRPRGARRAAGQARARRARATASATAATRKRGAEARVRQRARGAASACCVRSRDSVSIARVPVLCRAKVDICPVTRGSNRPSGRACQRMSYLVGTPTNRLEERGMESSIGNTGGRHGCEASSARSCALVAAGAATMAAAAPAQAGIAGRARRKNCDDPARRRRSSIRGSILAQLRAGARWRTPSRPPAGTSAAARRSSAGNEPWKVGNSTDNVVAARSRAGSSATTGVMCVGIGHPTMRFFAKRTSGIAARPAHGRGRVRGPRRHWSRACRSASSLGGGSWQPTLPYPVHRKPAAAAARVS